MKRTVVSLIRKFPRVYDAINNKRTTHGELGKWLNSLSEYGRLRFVQVGASDGLRWDPLRKHIIKNGWSGVFIEPLPPVFELLKKNYAYVKKRQSLTFVNAAISHTSGNNLTFWTCSESFLRGLNIDRQLYWLRMSSLQYDFLANKIESVTGKKATANCIVKIDTPIKMLPEIIDQHLGGRTPDLLFIDAEGHDDSVIYGLSHSPYKPRWIIYESTALGASRSADLKKHLIEQGYKLSVLGSDTLASLETG